MMEKDPNNESKDLAQSLGPEMEGEEKSRRSRK